MVPPDEEEGFVKTLKYILRLLLLPLILVCALLLLIALTVLLLIQALFETVLA